METLKLFLKMGMYMSDEFLSIWERLSPEERKMLDERFKTEEVASSLNIEAPPQDWREEE